MDLDALNLPEPMCIIIIQVHPRTEEKPIEPPRTGAELILATIEILGQFTSDHEWEQEILRIKPPRTPALHRDKGL